MLIYTDFQVGLSSFDLDLPLNSENCLVIIEWINLIPEKNNLNMDIFEIEIIDEQTRKITINV